MKLAFTTLGCPDWTIEQVAENAAAIGFDGVELRTHDDGNHCSPDASIDEAKRIRAVFDCHGVRIMSLMGYCSFAHLDPASVQRNQDLMRKLIALAGPLGATCIRTFGGHLPAGARMERMVEVVGDALRPLAADAAKRGISIALETHDDWCLPDVLLRLVQSVDSPKGFGIVFDVCNCIVAGHDWRTIYRRVQPNLRYCHVKDAYRTADGAWHYVPIGAGDIPWRDIVAALRTDRFRGHLSFEWEKKWHPELEPPERVFPHYVHKMQRLMKDDEGL